MIKFLFIYYFTLRNLKLRQLLSLLKKRILPSPKYPVDSNFYKLRENIERTQVLLLQDNTYINSSTFQFENTLGDLHAYNSNKSMLWNFHQNYLDFLNSDKVNNQLHTLHREIRIWISKIEYEDIVFLHPYPRSRRIINIINFLKGSNLKDDVIHSFLEKETRYLEKTLEWDLQANHLMLNVIALIYSNLFFDGQNANRKLKKYIEIFKNELDEQVLQDGAHYELSPMYQLILIIDLLRLQAFLKSYEHKYTSVIMDRVSKTISGMLGWIFAISHSSEVLSQFNDTAQLYCTNIDVVKSYAKTLGILPDVDVELPIHHFKDSGYVVMQRNGLKLIFKCADVMPSYQPGHTHADALSVELSFNERCVFQNLGTSTYSHSQRRMYERSTRAHNTVIVNDANSTEVWGSFRVARRAKITDMSINYYDNSVIAEHDGFGSILSSIKHRRGVRLTSNGIEITDTIIGNYATAEGFLHLHPECVFRVIDNQILISAREKKIKIQINGANFRILDTEFAHTFGVTEPSKSISYKFLQKDVMISITLV